MRHWNNGECENAVSCSIFHRVTQAELLLDSLIVPFNAPAHFSGPDQIYQRGVGGQRRQPVLR